MKRSLSRALLLSPLLLLITNISAREDKTMQLNVGPLFNFARYKFDCQPKNQGYLAGVHADFAHIVKCREYVGVRFDGRWNAGNVSGCEQENHIQDYRTELDLGYNFDVSWCKMEDLRLTPILGVGFFFLGDEFGDISCCSSSSSSCNPCSSSSGDCDFRYYNVFVPVGFKSEWRVNDCFSWGIDAEYRIDAWTRLKQNGSCDKQKLHSRTQGVLVEVPMTWQSGQVWCTDFQVKVVPLFDWNRFGRVDNCSSSTSCGGCSNSCGGCSSSSSGCSSFDNACCPEASQLTQWYLGLHVDLGVRF